MWSKNKKRFFVLLFMCFPLILGACSVTEDSTSLKEDKPVSVSDDSVLTTLEGYWVSTAEYTNQFPPRYYFDGESLTEMAGGGTEHLDALTVKSKNDSEKTVRLEYKADNADTQYVLTFLGTDTINIKRTITLISKEGEYGEPNETEFQWVRITEEEYEEILQKPVESVVEEKTINPSDISGRVMGYWAEGAKDSYYLVFSIDGTTLTQGTHRGVAISEIYETRDALGDEITLVMNKDTGFTKQGFTITMGEGDSNLHADWFIERLENGVWVPQKSEYDYELTRITKEEYEEEMNFQ